MDVQCKYFVTIFFFSAYPRVADQWLLDPFVCFLAAGCHQKVNDAVDHSPLEQRALSYRLCGRVSCKNKDFFYGSSIPAAAESVQCCFSERTIWLSSAFFLLLGTGVCIWTAGHWWVCCVVTISIQSETELEYIITYAQLGEQMTHKVCKKVQQALGRLTHIPCSLYGDFRDR